MGAYWWQQGMRITALLIPNTLDHKAACKRFTGRFFMLINLRRKTKEQIRGKNHQMHHAWQTGGAARAQRIGHHKQRQNPYCKIRGNKRRTSFGNHQKNRFQSRTNSLIIAKTTVKK